PGPAVTASSIMIFRGSVQALAVCLEEADYFGRRRPFALLLILAEIAVLFAQIRMRREPDELHKMGWLIERPDRGDCVGHLSELARDRHRLRFINACGANE